ncbi:MAG: gliding motility-associated C-terminal domain-containing protein [Candidatus Handelsmanbacteria bacterium]|nr:gliding motility-associated C-terminal domain-containing protein [Candidatus Handelsmanbacteria bacterium]
MPALLLFLALPVLLAADELRFDTPQQWQTWKLPLGALEFTAEGDLKPVQIRKHNNAALDAGRFGGGIRSVGSNPGSAPLVMDGDPATGWAPDLAAPLEDRFIEINLGRGVSAYRVVLVFAEDAPPFELFDLMLSTGEQQLDQIANPIPNTLVYRISERFKENTRHRLVYELDRPEHTPIQYLRLAVLQSPPGARLTEVEVEGVGDNLLANLRHRGGDIEIIVDTSKPDEAVQTGNAQALIDGDLTSRWQQRNEPRAPYDIWGNITLDLGAVYWVDWFRLIGGVVVRSGNGGGITTAAFVSRRSFIYKYYEVLTSDGSLAPDGSRVWTKHYADYPTDESITMGMADHKFDSQPTRYVRFVWRVWDAACAVAVGGTQGRTSQFCLVTGATEELQVYSEGYPQSLQFHSHIIDLGTDRNLQTLSWGGDAPAGTRVELRSRTGDQVVEQLTYRDKDGKEVTQKKYEKLIPSFRGPIDTLLVAGGDWSPWSKIYAFSGEAFQSPSPRRYLELDARLVSDHPDRAASLDWLTIAYTPPLASRALGEINPPEVRPGESTEFSYFLRPEGAAPGLDRLAVEATVPLRFTGAYLDGQPAAAQVDSTAAGFQVLFPSALRSDQLVELRFASAVFHQSTRFDLFLEDSRTKVRQPAEPGDATELSVSNGNVVRLPVAQDLLANLRYSPILTPNGDGINDQLELSLDLVNVLAPRPLRLRLFDLAGRLVHADELLAQAGHRAFSWDGRAGGRLLPPGLYLLELSIEGDARQERARRLVQVAY